MSKQDTKKQENKQETEIESEKTKDKVMQVYERNLNIFKRFLDIVQGKTDIRKRIQVLLKPELPQTTSRLSASQVSYVVDQYWIAEIDPDFACLRADADNLLRTMLSYKGYGIEKTIDLQKALTVSEKWFETTIDKKARAKREKEKQKEHA